MAQPIANQPSPSQVSGRLATWHRVMEEAGLTYNALQIPIDDPEFRKRLVHFWLSGGFEATTSQRRAREIMGRNMFGVEEAIKHFGVNPAKQQVAALSEISFSEATLEECKKTHILVAVFSLSILEIRGKAAADQCLFYDQDWYNKESFAKEKGEMEWELVCKTPVANSTSKTWAEQHALLADNEETPTARVMVYTIIGHFLATGERLFQNIYVRCSNLDSDDRRVIVGNFGQCGLFINDSWDDIRYSKPGLSSSLKFQGEN